MSNLATFLSPNSSEAVKWKPFPVRVSLRVCSCLLQVEMISLVEFRRWLSVWVDAYLGGFRGERGVVSGCCRVIEEG